MSRASYTVKHASFPTPWGVRYFRHAEERTNHNTSSHSESRFGGAISYSRSSKSITGLSCACLALVSPPSSSSKSPSAYFIHARGGGSYPASSYSCYKAHYPRLYEKLKSPAAARKNFKEWKATVLQLPPESRPALPPQELTFAELRPTTDKRGELLVLVCNLQPSYPNFDLACTTEFKERHEVHNGAVLTDIRGAGAVITTTANSWRILIEQTGWNSDVLRAALGSETMDALEEVKTVRKGDSAVEPIVGQFDKKITLSAEYAVDRMWSKTTGFYRVEIYIPKRTYRHKRYW